MMVVKATPDFWVGDGTPSNEVARLRSRIYMDAEAVIPAVEGPSTRIDRRIPDTNEAHKLIEPGELSSR